ncbi:hypothetical protein NDA13_003612 [Ustilago tritici]|nr:hypothetical protein NDA13_003612 [Ustilago tritici]
MSNIDYSIYDAFVVPVQGLFPRLPKILQNQFNQVMEDKLYGTPNTPKDGQLLKFVVNDDKEQIITPLSIMIECGTLYHTMHNLGHEEVHSGLHLFAELGAASERANKEWDATCILSQDRMRRRTGPA